MRVRHVAYTDVRGGAARAAYRLHRALCAQGHDSRMLVRHKYSTDGTVETVLPAGGKRGLEARDRAERTIARLLGPGGSTVHSANVLPTRWPMPEADVLHLQWIGNGTISVADIERIRRPRVLTLHDMWGFCGSAHYASDAEDSQWRVGYTRRGQGRAPGTRLDLDRITWGRKQRHWSPMNIVAPSTWLADCARRSALMADWPIAVVPYALDVRHFRPRAPVLARQSLGLPLEQRVILFGAPGGTTDPRKGFDLLADALRILGDIPDAVCVVFGQERPPVEPDLGLPIRWLGVVDDDDKLAEIYNAGDVMIVPSRQEALGQTATEALACGTPVVAFGATGLLDVVEHGRTGYLAEPFSPASMAAGIRWVLGDQERLAKMRVTAQRRAEDLWSPAVVAHAYVRVYEDAVERHRRRRPHGS